MRRVAASFFALTLLICPTLAGPPLLRLGGVCPNLVINGNFALNPLSASQSTVQNGWQWMLAPATGTATVVWGANAVTVTGDGTNTAQLGTAALITAPGISYTITADITGSITSVRVGTGAFQASLFNQNSLVGKAQQFQFIATTTTSFVTFARQSVASPVIANVSIQKSGGC